MYLMIDIVFCLNTKRCKIRANALQFKTDFSTLGRRHAENNVDKCHIPDWWQS